MRNYLLAVGVVVALMVPALAENEAAGPQQSAAASSSEDEAHQNDMVCKKMPPPTGSRLGAKTVCMTNREWSALWDDSKRATSNMQGKGITYGAVGGGGN